MIMINRFLRRIDVFGAEVGIKFEGKSKYTSRFGGLSSLLVMGLLLALFYQQSIQIYSRDVSNVIYQQQHVEVPSRYDLTPDKFSFMIGVFNSEFQPIIDEQIYYLEAVFNQKQQITHSNGTTTVAIVPKYIQIGPCSSDDFQQIDVKDYFLSQSYQNLYCLKNKTDLYLEGQFDSNTFTLITIDIKECISLDCKDENIRQTFLESSYVQIYFTNRILELSNYDNPFKGVGKTLFYNTFYDYCIITSLIFINTEVVDDNGLFVRNTQSQKELVFSTDRQQLSKKTSNSIFQCNIFLEKDNENMFQRDYKKIPEIISQLGGTFQVLFFFGCFIIKPYNQFRLQNRLYKDIFSEDNGKENKKQLFNKIDQSQNTLKRIEIKVNSQLDQKPTPRNSGNIQAIQDQQNNTFNLSAIKVALMKKIKNCCTIFSFAKSTSSQSFTSIQRKKQQIEIFRSLKTIINTQIQFKRIQQLIFQTDQNIEITKDRSPTNDENYMMQKKPSENSLQLIKSAIKKELILETRTQEQTKSPTQDITKLQANLSLSQFSLLNQSASMNQSSYSKNQNQVFSSQIRKIKSIENSQLNNSIQKVCNDKCITKQKNNQQFDNIFEESTPSSIKIKEQDNTKHHINANCHSDQHLNKRKSLFDQESYEPSIQYKNEDYIKIFKSINDKNLLQKECSNNLTNYNIIKY